MSTETFIGTVRVELTRVVKTNHDTGAVSYRNEKIGMRTAQINLQIDVAELTRLLGSKAALAKGKKSKLQGGLIVAEVVSASDEMVPS